MAPSDHAVNAGLTSTSLPVDVEHDNHHITPAGPQEKSGGKWSTVEQQLPAPIVRCGRKLIDWVKGPVPRHTYTINPLLKPAQETPIRLLRRLPWWVRVCVYIIACILWIVLFALLLTRFSLPSDIAGFGPPLSLSCVANLWPSPQFCGIDGRNCLPFTNSSIAFNCPANCLGAQVLNPRAIGNVSINYRPLVVGATQDATHPSALGYRGDSFICGAAIHAGVISNSVGGCGVISLLGQKTLFPSVESNGIQSIAFDSTFPMAFDFTKSDAVSKASSKCRGDPRWALLVLSTVFTGLFGLFTWTPDTFFAPCFTIIFFQVGMASDPPPYNDYASLASIVIGRFLPAALVAALFHRFSVRKTLTNCKANVEKTLFWLGSAWVGALSNYTFEKIPIQRLTGHDIRQQPGAVTALVIIVLVLLAIILYQAWCLRNEGRLPRYLALYFIFGISLGILSAMPHLTLRIHHYILALLLLPGTALQTRISLLCQGLLVGLFINGIARWDFDSILQTAAQLRADALLGSNIPSILEPIITNTSITFTWQSLLHGYDGVSVLVNDVERYRGLSDEMSFTWNRTSEGTDEFFRFGFVNYAPFNGVGYSDFTKAGVWLSNGTWSGIPSGRTGI